MTDPSPDCPLQSIEDSALLLDYCARRLDAGRRRVLEQHMAVCPRCQAFRDEQAALWDALDEFEPEPLSWGFDRKLEEAAARRPGWLERLGALFGGIRWKPALPVAVAFALWIVVSPVNGPVGREAQKEAPASLEQPSAETMERALEDLDMLQQIRLNG